MGVKLVTICLAVAFPTSLTILLFLVAGVCGKGSEGLVQLLKFDCQPYRLYFTQHCCLQYVFSSLSLDFFVLSWPFVCVL